MSEISNPLEELQAGDVIEFADITELSAFEDMVAVAVEPGMTELAMERWSGRAALRDLIKPPKFNGRISNIRLLTMEEPYERLIDCTKRGWTVAKGGKSFMLSTEYASLLIPRYKGYTMTADAISTGKGIIGQIQTELWYYPLPISQVIRYNILQSGEKSYYLTTQKARSGNMPLRRAVAKPKFEQEKFITLDERSKKIGFGVLRSAMLHPIIQPIHM